MIMLDVRGSGRVWSAASGNMNGFFSVVIACKIFSSGDWGRRRWYYRRKKRRREVREGRRKGRTSEKREFITGREGRERKEEGEFRYEELCILLVVVS